MSETIETPEGPVEIVVKTPRKVKLKTALVMTATVALAAVVAGAKLASSFPIDESNDDSPETSEVPTVDA